MADYLRPSDSRYPFDPEQYRQSPEDYLRSLVTVLRSRYRDIWRAFKLVDQDFITFKPTRTRSANAPTDLEEGELRIWSDSDDDSVYLYYRDANAGNVSVQLT